MYKDFSDEGYQTKTNFVNEKHKLVIIKRHLVKYLFIILKNILLSQTDPLVLSLLQELKI